MVAKLDKSSNSSSARALQLMKVFLLLLIVGLSFAGKQESTWPITTWVLYSGYSARFRLPEPATSAIQIRIYTASDDLYIIKPEEILSLPYDSLSHSIVEQAFVGSDPQVKNESRKYLVKTLAKFIPPDAEIKTVQAWELSYAVDALQIPPIDQENPAAEIMLDSFTVAEL